MTSTPEVNRQPEWQTLPTHIKAMIESTANAVDTEDIEQAQERIADLNRFLQEEGVIGRDVRLSTAAPIVSEEIFTSSGIETRPVYEGPFMNKTDFEGAFSGCSLVQYANAPNRYLAYDVASLSPEGFYYTKGIYDATKIKIQREIEFSEDESDSIIAGAFEVLESVVDEDYAETVKLFREAFENFDQPMVLRLRQLGASAALLMEHPVHAQWQVRTSALHALLRYALDEDLEYLMKGYEVHDTSGDEAETPRVGRVKNALRVQYVGITYVDNFDITSSSDDDIELDVHEGKQPAITFFDTAARYERIFPFKFLAKIEEYQYREEEFGQEVTPQLGATGISLYCGDSIRDFMRRVETGEAQYAKGVLKSYQPRV